MFFKTRFTVIDMNFFCAADLKCKKKQLVTPLIVAPGIISYPTGEYYRMQGPVLGKIIAIFFFLRSLPRTCQYYAS